MLHEQYTGFRPPTFLATTVSSSFISSKVFLQLGLVRLYAIKRLSIDLGILELSNQF